RPAAHHATAGVLHRTAGHRSAVRWRPRYSCQLSQVGQGGPGSVSPGERLSNRLGPGPAPLNRLSSVFVRVTHLVPKVGKVRVSPPGDAGEPLRASAFRWRPNLAVDQVRVLRR